MLLIPLVSVHHSSIRLYQRGGKGRQYAVVYARQGVPELLLGGVEGGGVGDRSLHGVGRQWARRLGNLARKRTNKN